MLVTVLGFVNLPTSFVDPCIRFLSSKQLKHEESLVSGFHPATNVRDVLIEYPGVNRRKLKKDGCFQHLLTIWPTTKRWTSIVASTREVCVCDKAWVATVKSVPQSVTKFALNAVCDTLPHRSNLRKWGKMGSDACPLCGHRYREG